MKETMRIRALKTYFVIALLLVIVGVTPGLVAQIKTGGFTAISGSSFDFSLAGIFKLPSYHAGAFNSGTQSIPNNTSTPLTFNTNAYDTSGYHSTTVNPTRFTVPANLGGTQSFTCQYAAAAAGAGAGNILALSVNVNGSPINNQVTAQVSTAFGPTLVLTVNIPMNAGDYAECIAFQGSGGSLNTQATVTLASMFRSAY
jgi:hypothetical protein